MVSIFIIAIAFFYSFCFVLLGIYQWFQAMLSPKRFWLCICFGVLATYCGAVSVVRAIDFEGWVHTRVDFQQRDLVSLLVALTTGLILAVHAYDEGTIRPEIAYAGLLGLYQETARFSTWATYAPRCYPLVSVEWILRYQDPPTHISLLPYYYGYYGFYGLCVFMVFVMDILRLVPRCMLLWKRRHSSTAEWLAFWAYLICDLGMIVSNFWSCSASIWPHFIITTGASLGALLFLAVGQRLANELNTAKPKAE